MKTLVLGLGNTILRDDGVGIRIVEEAQKQTNDPDIDFDIASVGGLRLLDNLIGYQRIILVDAIQTESATPGDILWLKVKDLQATLHSGSSHDLSLAGALRLGHGLQMDLAHNDNIHILAIQVEDVLNFGESCTPRVAAAIPKAVNALLAELARQNQGTADHG